MDTTPTRARAARAAPRALPRFGPRSRAALRSAHAVAGAGWVGGHATLLTLAAIALAGPAAERDTALAGAGLAAGALVLPLSLATLATGLALSLGTHWGLVQHWWVAVKLALTAALVVGSNLSIGPAVRAAGADPAVAPADAVLSFDADFWRLCRAKG